MAARQQRRVAVDDQHRPLEVRARRPAPPRRRGRSRAAPPAPPRRAPRGDGGEVRRRPASRPAPTTTSVRAGAQRLGGGQDVAEHAAPAEGVQHLGGRRAHAGALPGGEDDDGGDAPALLRARTVLLRRSRISSDGDGGGVAGGLGLEPRLHGSKGRRAADYPIPHPRRRPAALARRPRATGTRSEPEGRPAPWAAAGHRAAVRRSRLPVARSRLRCRRLRARSLRSTNTVGDRSRDGRYDTASGGSSVRSRPHPAHGSAAPADPDAGLPANAYGKEKGALETGHALPVRARAVPRPGRDRPGRLGLGALLARPRPRWSASTSSPCSA